MYVPKYIQVRFNISAWEIYIFSIIPLVNVFKWAVFLSPVISGGPLSILRFLFSELSAIPCFRCAFTSVPVMCSSNANVKVECCTNHCLTIHSVSQTQYNLFLYKWQLPSKFPAKCSSYIGNSKSTPIFRECYVSSSFGKTNNKFKQSAASRITHLLGFIGQVRRICDSGVGVWSGNIFTSGFLGKIISWVILFRNTILR